MNQKKLAVLTLFVVVLGAVLINEFILRKSATYLNSDSNNREVASFGERFEPERIKWEQELAKSVSKDTGKTLLGEKPSLHDKFLFEALAGKYEANFIDGKLLKIKLIDKQTPLILKTEELIKNHASIFKGAQSFAHSFEKSASDAVTENLDLKDAKGQSIGKATILRDDQGRVTSIEVQ